MCYKKLLLLMVLCLGFASAQTEYSEEVKRLVVMLENEVGGEYEIGAGIVFALARNRIYIATASHVVDAEDDAKLTAKFWQLPGETFEASVLAPLDTSLDMSVVSVRVEDVGLKLEDFPFELLTGGDIETSEKVISVGQGSGRPWVTLEQDLNVIGKEPGILEVQFSGVSQGDSGGGIFNERGELLGLIISDAPPALRAIDAETLLTTLEQNQYEISVSRPKLPEEGSQTGSGGNGTAAEDATVEVDTVPSITPDESASGTTDIAVTTVATPINEPAKLQIDGAQGTTSFADNYSGLQAIDGDPETYWSTAPNETSKAGITFLFKEAKTISSLNMFFVADPVGLLPKEVILSTPNGESREITFRGLAGWESASFEALTTDTFILTPTSYFSVGSPSFVNIYELELYGY